MYTLHDDFCKDRRGKGGIIIDQDNLATRQPIHFDPIAAVLRKIEQSLEKQTPSSVKKCKVLLQIMGQTMAIPAPPSLTNSVTLAKRT